MTKETFDSVCEGTATFTGRTLKYTFYMLAALLLAPLLVILLPLMVIYGACRNSCKDYAGEN